MASHTLSSYPQWLSPERSVTEPAAFARDIEAEDAVVCFSKPTFTRLVEAFDLSIAEDAPRFAGALESAMDESIAIHWGYFGGPAAGVLMETLIASGVERIVLVGTAGAISPRCTIGDLVLPTWGLREEGVSYHYLRPDVRCEASSDLLGAIKRSVTDMDVVEGGVWTTDALFRETMDKVQAYAKRGVLAVEMECTALMAIAMVRRVDFAAALVITDHVFSGTWVRHFRDAEVERTKDLLCRALASGFRQRGRFLEGTSCS